MDRHRPTDEQQQRLRALVDAHFDAVWRWVRAFGVPASTADDAVQRVFLIVESKLDAIGPGRERSFLFSTTRGVAANMRRAIAHRREEFDSPALGGMPDDGLDPEAALADKQAKQLLEQVLESMPADLREVFVLFELEELTTGTIAEVLEIPTGTVASRLRRAREEFKLAVLRLRASRIA